MLSFFDWLLRSSLLITWVWGGVVIFFLILLTITNTFAQSKQKALMNHTLLLFFDFLQIGLLLASLDMPLAPKLPLFLLRFVWAGLGLRDLLIGIYTGQYDFPTNATAANTLGSPPLGLAGPEAILDWAPPELARGPVANWHNGTSAAVPDWVQDELYVAALGLLLVAILALALCGRRIRFCRSLGAIAAALLFVLLTPALYLLLRPVGSGLGVSPLWIAVPTRVFLCLLCVAVVVGVFASLRLVSTVRGNTVSTLEDDDFDGEDDRELQKVLSPSEARSGMMTPMTACATANDQRRKQAWLSGPLPVPASELPALVAASAARAPSRYRDLLPMFAFVALPTRHRRRWFVIVMLARRALLPVFLACMAHTAIPFLVAVHVLYAASMAVRPFLSHWRSLVEALANLVHCAIWILSISVLPGDALPAWMTGSSSVQGFVDPAAVRLAVVLMILAGSLFLQVLLAVQFLHMLGTCIRSRRDGGEMSDAERAAYGWESARDTKPRSPLTPRTPLTPSTARGLPGTFDTPRRAGKASHVSPVLPFGELAAPKPKKKHSRRAQSELHPASPRLEDPDPFRPPPPPHTRRAFQAEHDTRPEEKRTPRRGAQTATPIQPFSSSASSVQSFTTSSARPEARSLDRSPPPRYGSPPPRSSLRHEAATETHRHSLRKGSHAWTLRSGG